MPQWVGFLLEVAKLCQIQAAVAVLIMLVVLLLAVVRWVRGYHRQTLVLMRNMAFQMIQNRPPTDDSTCLQQNLSWWETQVISILPKAGAKSGEIARFARFGAPGNVYHRAMIAEKITRLDVIIARLEGEA